MMTLRWSLYGLNRPRTDPAWTMSRQSSEKKYDCLVIRSEYTNAAPTSSAKAISTGWREP